MERLLIALAIPPESKVLTKLLKDMKTFEGPWPENCRMYSGSLMGFPVDILVSGMGLEAAAIAAQECIRSERHGGILVMGFCGGLSHTTKVGDTVFATRVISALDGSCFETDAEVIEELGKSLIQEGFKYRTVPLISWTQVAESKSEKEKLLNEYHAEAVDMETAELVREAARQRLKSAVAKIVIDDLEDQLPPFNETFRRTGKMDSASVGEALGHYPAKGRQHSKNIKVGSQVFGEITRIIVPVVCETWNIMKC
jgi:nucleoside phosphorylase